MKKTVSALLALVMCVGVCFCGCGKKDSGKVAIALDPVALSPMELADLDKFAADNGYESARYNEKTGTIDVVLNTVEHDKLTYSLGVSVIRNVYALVDSEKYPYIKDIKRNDNFTEMTVLVNRKAYEKAGDSEGVSDFIGENCMTYLKYEALEESQKVCTVKFADIKTGEVLGEKTYSAGVEKQ